jgi:hypothetical protein
MLPGKRHCERKTDIAKTDDCNLQAETLPVRLFP